jgi:hypothetical protein
MLATVDPRPNSTGQKRNGQPGVAITNTTSHPGEFRYLRFVLPRARWPLQAGVKGTRTLFAAIDVNTKETLAQAGNATATPDYSHIKAVMVVIKTHFDIGYSHRVH